MFHFWKSNFFTDKTKVALKVIGQPGVYHTSASPFTIRRLLFLYNALWEFHPLKLFIFITEGSLVKMKVRTNSYRFFADDVMQQQKTLLGGQVVIFA